MSQLSIAELLEQPDPNIEVAKAVEKYVDVVMCKWDGKTRFGSFESDKELKQTFSAAAKAVGSVEQLARIVCDRLIERKSLRERYDYDEFIGSIISRMRNQPRDGYAAIDVERNNIRIVDQSNDSKA